MTLQPTLFGETLHVGTDTQMIERPRKKKGPPKIVRGPCTVEGCDRITHCAASGTDLCYIHYHRFHKGIPLISPRDRFTIDNPPKNGEYYLPLSRGKVTRVDQDIYEKFKWKRLSAMISGNQKHLPEQEKRYYAQVYFEGYKKKLLHRYLLDAPEDMFVDHINGDPLDNRRCNLRCCNNLQNSQNCMPKKKTAKIHSRFKGVGWRHHIARWGARIKFKGRNVYLGDYDNEEDAAIAYDVGAQILHGEFACTNAKIKKRSQQFISEIPR